MSLEPDITFEGEFVLFRYTGPDSFQISIEQMTRLAKTCEDFRCFKILGVTEFSNPLTTMEAYDYQYLFEEARITNKYRIAWVEKNPEARKNDQIHRDCSEESGFGGPVVFRRG